MGRSLQWRAPNMMQNVHRSQDWRWLWRAQGLFQYLPWWDVHFELLNFKIVQKLKDLHRYLHAEIWSICMTQNDGWLYTFRIKRQRSVVIVDILFLTWGKHDQVIFGDSSSLGWTLVSFSLSGQTDVPLCSGCSLSWRDVSHANDHTFQRHTHVACRTAPPP